MIQFEIKKEDLIHRDLPKGLKVSETKDPYIIHKCIELFNEDLEWDGMFNVFDALRRIDYGERMFVASFNGVIFGHCWVDKTEKDKFYIYNVFSKKTEEPRKYGATDMLYKVIKTYTKGIVWVKVDEWNVRSIKVFEKLGFTRTN